MTEVEPRRVPRAIASRLGVLLALAAPLTLASAAPADTAPADAPLALRTLAAQCAGCHGQDGRAALADIPPLAGRPRAALLDQLLALREGRQPATVMPQIARGFTPEQLGQLADYFARVRLRP